MPEPGGRLAFPALTARGRWRARLLAETVTLCVESREVVVRLDASGEELAAPMPAIRGASWRAGTLALHLADEELHLLGGDGLDLAWHAVIQRACTLPEVARGLRALGATFGPLATAHDRFFTPILQARRRLEGDEPMPWKVAGFDADTLAARMRATLAAMALERHAQSPPHRRALEAEMLEACEPLFRALALVASSARDVRDGDDAQLFVEWRRWAGAVRALFVDAGRSWTTIAAVLAHADRGFPIDRGR